MQTLEFRIGYLINQKFDLKLNQIFETYEQNGLALNLNNISASSSIYSFDLLIIEKNLLNDYINLNLNTHPQKTILLYDHHEDNIKTEHYNALTPVEVIDINNFDLLTVESTLNQIDTLNQTRDIQNIAFQQQIIDEQIKKDLLHKIQYTNEELVIQKQLILDSKNRNDSLIKILFSISAETEISRIETVLNELLPKSTSATWIRIVPESLTAAIESDLKKEFFNFYIKKKFSNFYIYFVISNVEFFKKTEYDIFQNIADVLDTIISKLRSIQEQQKLEKLVSTAFNSTFYPVLIVNKDYTIIESNKAFEKFPSSHRKCFEAMFNRTSPCFGCQLGASFQLNIQGSNHESLFFNVQSQKIRISEDLNSYWFHFYSDVTEEKLLEQRLTQTVKMKELGLVSSSIAHELNNPLGGIISYIQILQMELDKNHVLQNDLKEMSTAALRMKTIIENLLVFSRRPVFNEKTVQSLSEIIQEAVRLNELQFRIENIKVVQHTEDIKIEKSISKTAFRDSINLIFNFFTEGLKRVRMGKNNFPGLIEVKITQDQMNFYLNFESNVGPLSTDQKTKNIYFLIIHKSLIDQGFQVELTEPNTSWVAIKITILKQDLDEALLLLKS